MTYSDQESVEFAVSDSAIILTYSVASEGGEAVT
jgi:hypothetical protein